MTSKAQNRKAGTAPISRDKRGKHTGAKYRPGDNWIECQRCGHDCLGSDALFDGYIKGLIVCPSCYDSPHPQDYVRAYTDRIAPGSGISITPHDYDTTGAVGSTEVPTTTFGDDS